MDWTLFYKLIGLPESAKEPTYYQLLGVSPQSVTPAVVERCLSERKRQLRQKIPGRQMIPVIARFEQELDLGARILSDPVKRQAYHQRLQREGRVIEQPTVPLVATAEPRTASPPPSAGPAPAPQQRPKTDSADLAERVRRLIRTALAVNGTLNQSQQAALARELMRMGVNRDDVQTLLSRIPCAGQQ